MSELVVQVLARGFADQVLQLRKNSHSKIFKCLIAKTKQLLLDILIVRVVPVRPVCIFKGPVQPSNPSIILDFILMDFGVGTHQESSSSCC